MAESIKTVGVTPAKAAGTCLLCHTIDHGVTQDGLDAGGYWRCPRCGQTWDSSRLSAALAYSLRPTAH